MLLTHHGINSLQYGVPPLPVGYQRVEYLKCALDTGVPVINGGVQLDYADKISIKFYFDAPINGTNWMYFFYTMDFGKRSFKLEGTGQRAYLRWASPATYNETQIHFTDGELLFEFSTADGLWLNGTRYAANIGQNDGVKTLDRIAHFATNQSCKLYYFVVKDSADAIKYNLVPALRLSNMKTGLYDTVHDNFIAVINGWTLYGPYV